MGRRIEDFHQWLNRSRSAPEQEGRALFFMLAFAVILFQNLLYAIQADGFGANALFGDSDPYLYFNRVERLEGGAGWFDRVDPLANAPEGHEQHWTRPIDLILWGGARMLTPWMEFKDALAFWGSLWSPLLLAILVGVMIWALRPLGKGLAICGAVIGVVQFNTLQLFQWGEADHHTLIVVLWAVSVGLLIRLALGEEKEFGRALLLGATAGFAIWVNLEGMVFAVVNLAVIGFLWLFGGDRWAKVGALTALATTAMILFGGLVEFGGEFWSQRKADLVSVPIALSFLAATGFWGLLWGSRRWLGAPTRQGRLLKRGAVAVGGALLTMGAIALLAPELLAGPYSERLDLYVETRLVFLGEHLPPVITERNLSMAVQEAVFFFALPLVGLLGAISRVIHRRGERDGEAWIAATLLLGAFFLLATQQRRWGSYLDLSAVIGYGVLAQALFEKAQEFKERPLWGGFVRPVTVIGLAIWPIALAGILGAAAGAVSAPGGSEERGNSVEAAEKEELGEEGEGAEGPGITWEFCDLRPLRAWMEENLERMPAVTLLPAERGAEWIFRTGTGAIAVGNHRPQSGFVLKHEIFGARDYAQAYKAMEGRGIEAVLICESAPRMGWLQENFEKEGLNLYGALFFGEEVEGLELLVRGEKVGNWKLYGTGEF